MSIRSDQQINVKGLSCPMPVIKTRQAMNGLHEGQVLEVQATDQGSLADLKAWAESVGHQYIGVRKKNGVLFHYLRKCGGENEKEKTFQPTIANEAILERAANGSLILDVREEAEYAFGHIEGAKSIPLGELEERMNELDPNQEILVICHTGTRSDLAAKKLVEKGFKKVWNVLPGMCAWNGPLIKKI